MTRLISLADFQRIKFIPAKVASAKVNKTKVPAFLCSLDVGHSLLEEHQRLHDKPLYTSSAQLTVQHTIEEVDGRTLLTVANFPRKQIGPRMSDCLITGVQVNSNEEASRKASTVMVQCSHAVQPGMLITVTGHVEQLQTNARDLSWDNFMSASIVVGTVIDAAGSHAVEENDCLSAHEVTIDFGESLGPQSAQAILHNKVFASIQDWLNMQVLAVTNLSSDEGGTARVAVLTVGGLAVLQPAKEVANGYLLA